jgi:hypothetical protein
MGARLTPVLYPFSSVPMPIKTRGDLLRLDLFMALSDAVKLVRGTRKAMTIAEREAIADSAVRRIASRSGDPCGGSMRRCHYPAPPSATARRTTGLNRGTELAHCRRSSIFRSCVECVRRKSVPRKSVGSRRRRLRSSG